MTPNQSLRPTAYAAGEFVVRGTPPARRERGELSLRSSACSSGRRRRPFEQSLEPRRPNAVVDRTSTPGAKPTRLSSPR